MAWNLPTLFNRNRLPKPGVSNFTLPQFKFDSPQLQPPVQAGTPFPMPQQIQTPAMDQYQQHVQGYPQYENPSGWRKLAAVLTGAGVGWQNPLAGIEAAREVRDEPFNRKLQDWAMKGEGLKNAASLESMNLGRENSANRNVMNYDLGMNRVGAQLAGLDVKMEGIRAVERAARERNIRTEVIVDEKTRKAQLVAFNPATQEITVIGNSAELTPQEVIDLRKSLAQTSANATLGAASIGAESRKNVEQMRIDAGAYEDEPTGPSNADRVYVDKETIKQLLAEMPEAQQFITFQGGQGILVKPPKTMFNDQTATFDKVKARHDEILAQKRTQLTPPKVRPTGPVKMKAPDGRTVFIPANQVEEAKRRGAVEIR